MRTSCPTMSRNRSWYAATRPDAGVLEDLLDPVEGEEECREPQLGLRARPVLPGPVVEDGDVDSADGDSRRAEGPKDAPVLLLRRRGGRGRGSRAPRASQSWTLATKNFAALIFPFRSAVGVVGRQIELPCVLVRRSSSR